MQNISQVREWECWYQDAIGNSFIIFLKRFCLFVIITSLLCSNNHLNENKSDWFDFSFWRKVSTLLTQSVTKKIIMWIIQLKEKYNFEYFLGSLQSKLLTIFSIVWSKRWCIWLYQISQHQQIRSTFKIVHVRM